MPFLNNSRELIEKFNLGEADQYCDPIEFTDQKVGFSIKRKYPQDIRFKPAKDKDGNPDDVAVIWVSYTHQEESKVEIKEEKVPLTIKISTFSKYRSKHFDYDFNDKKSPTKESVIQSNNSKKPIALIFSNEFFFNHSTDSFFNEEGKQLKGKDILDAVFESHINTIHPIKGLKLQAKLLWQAKFIGLISLTIYTLTNILKLFFGRTLDADDGLTEYFHGYKRSQLKKLDQDSINIFSYKASKNIIIFFCIIVAIASYYSYTSKNTWGYFKFVGKNNTLSLSHSFLFLWLLDSVIPALLFRSINTLIKLRTYSSNLQFKHK